MCIPHPGKEGAKNQKLYIHPANVALYLGLILLGAYYMFKYSDGQLLGRYLNNEQYERAKHFPM